MTTTTRYPQSMLVSCEIPWDENEQLLEEVFRKEVRSVLAQGFTDLYVFGTAGEGYAVDTARFRDIVGVFNEETRGEGVRPMVGVIGLSTANVLERLAVAHDIGFRTFQISLPSWGVLRDDEVLTFFRDVCGAFPDSRFLHYNVPRSGRVLTGAQYRPLIDAVPNLVATKSIFDSWAATAQLIRKAPELQHFLGETNFAYGCMYGECSLLASAGPMSPHKAFELFEAGRKRDVAKMFELHQGFHNVIVDVLGPIKESGFIDGAKDKAIVRLGGLEEMPLRLLSPYRGITEEEYQACKRLLHERYPDWVAEGVD